KIVFSPLYDASWQTIEPYLEDTTPEEESLQDSTTEENTAPVVEIITKELRLGDTDEEVRELQKFLNERGFAVASSGPGSAGNETTLFGNATQNAVIRFQEAHFDILLAPQGLEKGTGVVDDLTRKLINS